MWTAGEATKLIESGQVCWPGELRGDGLLLRLGASLQSLIPAIAACSVDFADQSSIDQLYRPPEPQWDSFGWRPGRMALRQVDLTLSRIFDLRTAEGVCDNERWG